MEVERDETFFGRNLSNTEVFRKPPVGFLSVLPCQLLTARTRVSSWWRKSRLLPSSIFFLLQGSWAREQERNKRGCRDSQEDIRTLIAMVIVTDLSEWKLPLESQQEQE